MAKKTTLPKPPKSLNTLKSPKAPDTFESPDTRETSPEIAPEEKQNHPETLSAGKPVEKYSANDLLDKNLLLGTWRIAGIYIRCVRMLGKTSPLLRYPEDAAEHDLVLFRGRLWAVGRAWSKNDTGILSGCYWTFSADGLMTEWNGQRVREQTAYRFNPRTRKLLFGKSYSQRSGAPGLRLTEAFHIETDRPGVLQLYGLEYWAWRYENAPYRFELVRADPEKTKPERF